MATNQKTALITGASGGIGYELAKKFAADHVNLVLVARNAEKLKDVANELQQAFNVTVNIEPMNLATTGAADELFHHLQRHNITVDYLVNNAGFATYGKFSETDLSTELELIQLNITTLTHLTKLFVKGMVERGRGGIMNVASTASFQPGPLMAVYYASKSYVLFFSEALSNELKGTGVTVTALCPGPTTSDFQKRAKMEDSRLVSGKKIMSAGTVARVGYRGFMKGKTVVIPGFKNKLLSQSIRFSPRKLSTLIVRFLQEEKNH